MPYSDLDNEYAIMFQVGNGIPPSVPNDILNTEGKHFLSSCFQSDPNQRWNTSQLLEHSFVKVCDLWHNCTCNISSTYTIYSSTKF